MKTVLLVLTLCLAALSCSAEPESCPVLGQPMPAGLVITEIMPDPDGPLLGGVEDDYGEWIEILNALPYTLNPSGLQIASGAKSARLVCSATVAPGRLFVVARSSDINTNGGVQKVTCTYGTVSLPNSAGQPSSDPLTASRQNRVLLLGADGTVLDEVPYLVDVAGFPKVKKGASMQLCRDALSAEMNDFGIYWYHSLGLDEKLPSGDLASPGVLGKACGENSGETDVVEGEDSVPEVPNPEAGTVFISEFMADPKTVSDSQGEWFEIYYCGSEQVSLKGMYYQIDDGKQNLITDDIRILPGSFVVLARSNAAMPAANPPDGLFTGTLPNTGAHAIRLFDAQKVAISDALYGEGNTAGKVVAGASSQLCIDSNAACPASVTSWSISTTVFGVGDDKGTPGAPNEDCGGAQ